MYDRASDRDLAIRATGGDEGAQAALVERAKLPLAGYFSQLGAPDALIDDLVQEALIDALDSLRNFKEPYHFVGWSKTIGARVWSRHWAREGKRQRELEQVWRTRRQEIRNGGDPGERFSAELLEELARMPRERRQLLYDRYVERLTFQQLATRYGMTPSTVRREVHEVSDLLRRRMGGTSPQAPPGAITRPRSGEDRRRQARGKVGEP